MCAVLEGSALAGAVRELGIAFHEYASASTQLHAAFPAVDCFHVGGGGDLPVCVYALAPVLEAWPLLRTITMPVSLLLQHNHLLPAAAEAGRLARPLRMHLRDDVAAIAAGPTRQRVTELMDACTAAGRGCVWMLYVLDPSGGRAPPGPAVPHVPACIIS